MADTDLNNKQSQKWPELETKRLETAQASAKVDSKQRGLFDALSDVISAGLKDLYGDSNDYKYLYIVNLIMARVRAAIAEKLEDFGSDEIENLTKLLDAKLAAQTKEQYASLSQTFTDVVQNAFAELTVKVGADDKIELLDSVREYIESAVRTIRENKPADEISSKLDAVTEKLRKSFEQDKSGTEKPKTDLKANFRAKTQALIQQQLTILASNQKRLQTNMSVSFKRTSNLVGTNMNKLNSTLDTSMQGVTSKLGTITKKLNSLSFSNIMSGVNNVLGLLVSGPLKLLTGSLSMIWKGVWGLTKWAAGGLFSILGKFFKTPAGLFAIGYMIGYAWTKWIQPFWENTVKPIISPLKDWLDGKASFGEAIASTWDNFKEKITPLFNTVLDKVKAGLNWLLDLPLNNHPIFGVQFTLRKVLYAWAIVAATHYAVSIASDFAKVFRGIKGITKGVAKAFRAIRNIGKTFKAFRLKVLRGFARIKKFFKSIGAFIKTAKSFGKTIVMALSKLPGLGKLAGLVGKETAKTAAKAGAKAAGKAAAKAGAKAAGKAVGKAVLKKIPVIGLLAGIGFGISRAVKGDWAGAAGEIASGAASLVPGAGTALSAVIDAGLAIRDTKKAVDEQKTTQENVQEQIAGVQENVKEQISGVEKKQVIAVEQQKKVTDDLDDLIEEQHVPEELANQTDIQLEVARPSLSVTPTDKGNIPVRDVRIAQEVSASSPKSPDVMDIEYRQAMQRRLEEIAGQNKNNPEFVQTLEEIHDEVGNGNEVIIRKLDALFAAMQAQTVANQVNPVIVTGNDRYMNPAMADSRRPLVIQADLSR